MKTLRLMVLVGLAMSGVFLLSGGPKASAAEFGRDLGQSYYDAGRTTANTGRDWVFIDTPDIPYGGISQNWQTQPMTLEIFISEMRKRLYSPTPENSSRASAIMNAMMGINGDDSRFNSGTSTARWSRGVDVARANYAGWEALVRSYANGGIPGASVNFNDFFTNSNPTNWMGAHVTGDPDSRYPDIIYDRVGGAVTNVESIIFYNPDGTTFLISKICANLTGVHNALAQPGGGTVPPPPAPPVLPVTKPLFKTTGGDVAAGVTMATPTVPCATAQSIANAGIASWNNHGLPNFAGAGGEYAAMALGQVRDYVTGQGTGRTPAPPETNLLTLSNVDTGPSVDFATGVFGGLFAFSPCVDYWENKPADARLQVFNGTNLSGLNGKYRHSGTLLRLSASTIPANSHITIYVQGNVVISGNINYQVGTWADRTQIPSLRLIVNGVIHIAPGVTRLDGLYAAIPNANARTTSQSFASPLPGTISTCSVDDRAYNPNEFFTTDYRDACKSRLTINGSVVAHQFWMLRTLSGLASNTPAEIINYSPEMWLSTEPPASVTPDQGYQSVIGLPPIL